MEQINRIELRGNVGSVLVRTYNDQQVIRLTLATNFVYKGSGGEPVIETTWHNISAWQGKGMPDLSKIVKGCKLYVLGRVRNQKYTDGEGVEHISNEILARKIQIIDEEEPFQYEM